MTPDLLMEYVVKAGSGVIVVLLITLFTLWTWGAFDPEDKP